MFRPKASRQSTSIHSRKEERERDRDRDRAERDKERHQKDRHHHHHNKNVDISSNTSTSTSTTSNSLSMSAHPVPNLRSKTRIRGPWRRPPKAHPQPTLLSPVTPLTSSPQPAALSHHHSPSPTNAPLHDTDADPDADKIPTVTNISPSSLPNETADRTHQHLHDAFGDMHGDHNDQKNNEDGDTTHFDRVTDDHMHQHDHHQQHVGDHNLAKSLPASTFSPTSPPFNPGASFHNHNNNNRNNSDNNNNGTKNKMINLNLNKALSKSTVSSSSPTMTPTAIAPNITLSKSHPQSSSPDMQHVTDDPDNLSSNIITPRPSDCARTDITNTSDESLILTDGNNNNNNNNHAAASNSGGAGGSVTTHKTRRMKTSIMHHSISSNNANTNNDNDNNDNNNNNNNNLSMASSASSSTTTSTTTNNNNNNNNSNNNILTLGRLSAFQRFSALFRESDGRFDENLKSTKRRVVQVRRQPDSAPIRFGMGFRSRTGWEPIRIAKENQDCLVALVPWGPGSRFNFFAALDGHGRHGHICAIFIAEKVVAYLKRSLVALASDKTIATCLFKAILSAERKLEKIEQMDFSLSGSTGVFVLIHGTTLFCANVGDSRAILGRVVNNKATGLRKMNGNVAAASTVSTVGAGRIGMGLGNNNIGSNKSNVVARSNATLHHNLNRPIIAKDYVPVPLSFDQKPSRADEKARLLERGARVDSWESIDVGEERVWLPNTRIPGLAVSRSFGDLVLKPYGVNAVPEIYKVDLCRDDNFIVMASDGIFEFMSNDEVASIVGKWRDNGSAQDAAEELVRKALERWIDDDSVIDDISCVVVFMDVKMADVTDPQIPQLVPLKVGRLDNVSTSNDDDLDHAHRASDLVGTVADVDTHHVVSVGQIHNEVGDIERERSAVKKRQRWTVSIDANTDMQARDVGANAQQQQGQGHVQEQTRVQEQEQEQEHMMDDDFADDEGEDFDDDDDELDDDGDDVGGMHGLAGDEREKRRAVSMRTPGTKRMGMNPLRDEALLEKLKAIELVTPTMSAADSQQPHLHLHQHQTHNNSLQHERKRAHHHAHGHRTMGSSNATAAAANKSNSDSDIKDGSSAKNSALSQRFDEPRLL